MLAPEPPQRDRLFLRRGGGCSSAEEPRAPPQRNQQLLRRVTGSNSGELPPATLESFPG